MELQFLQLISTFRTLQNEATTKTRKKKKTPFARIIVFKFNGYILSRKKTKQNKTRFYGPFFLFRISKHPGLSLSLSLFSLCSLFDKQTPRKPPFTVGFQLQQFAIGKNAMKEKQGREAGESVHDPHHPSVSTHVG